jgi:hypothetical protein
MAGGAGPSCPLSAKDKKDGKALPFKIPPVPPAQGKNPERLRLSIILPSAQGI